LVARQAEMEELPDALILGHRREDTVGTGKGRGCSPRW